MAMVAHKTGSPTIGAVEYSLVAQSTTLATATEIGVYSLTLDTNALVDGDDFVLRAYEAGTPGGTKRLVESWPLTGPQGKPIRQFAVEGPLGNGFDWTLQKLLGIDRPFPHTLWRTF
jgi:hypothetical protein